MPHYPCYYCDSMHFNFSHCEHRDTAVSLLHLLPLHSREVWKETQPLSIAFLLDTCKGKVLLNPRKVHDIMVCVGV